MSEINEINEIYFKYRQDGFSNSKIKFFLEWDPSSLSNDKEPDQYWGCFGGKMNQRFEHKLVYANIVMEDKCESWDMCACGKADPLLFCMSREERMFLILHMMRFLSHGSSIGRCYMDEDKDYLEWRSKNGMKE